MLGQTLSPVAMSCAVGSRSAHEMWSNLRLKFAASNRQNILQLKSTLQGLKKGSDNIETYLDKIKAARDAFETVGVFLDDEDIVVTVLRGLPSEFVAIKTVIRAQFVSCSMGELKTLLKAAEVDIENESQPVTLTAMVAQSSTTPTTPSTPTTPISTPSVSPTVPTIPPGFNPLTSPTTSTIPSPISQPTYVPIPAVPYGFSPFNAFPMHESTLGMTGFYAGRGRGRLGGPGRGPHTTGRGFTGGIYNGNYNAGDFADTSNNASQSGYTFSCQLCGKPGHGARTCKTLSQYQPFV
ncbi:putative transcription factor interactor and regulator CCHC(Zn) family [Rosa chinensis]|uniref:Putative transcription factor interactor and regulator CCHC(Zn) family n=1 Tax=Rosa chinensis TaxID=74649 RepID=A0A2P6SCC5_ROSCH|nr:G8 domain-containing protein DDB_G0286311 [Rosa chinensis]XP_024176092.1 G8 domain-containing protein DDB_G0286311 [Rosa chinensis]PRQ56316.1 putative transcription factor interactor and regulator CCHC(Zn) family [Rosa chinensis]